MPYYRGTANVELVFCDIMEFSGDVWSIRGRVRRFRLSAVVEPLERGTCVCVFITGEGESQNKGKQIWSYEERR